MAGQHTLTTGDAVIMASPLVARPLSQSCPFNTTCDGCSVALRKGWPVRPSTGSGPVTTGFMCCACWWDRSL
jgi:hypothetical protein